MTEQSSSLFNDLTIKILLILLTSVITTAVAVFIERFKNRELRLKKTITYKLVAMSNGTDFWGQVEILYNGSAVKNLYLFNAQIINDTIKDAPKNMVITFSLEPGAFFLRDYGNVNNGDVQMGLKLEEEFHNKLIDVHKRWKEIPEGERWNDAQMNAEVQHVSTHRKYLMPILNRGKTAAFDFLVASDSPDGAFLNIGIYEPGVTLDWHESAGRHKKRSIWKNLIIMTIYIGMVFPVAYYAPTINWAVVLTVAISIPAYFVGLWIWMLLKYWKLI